MASYGRAKWVKYFSNGNVTTKVKNVSGKSAQLHSLDGKKVISIPEGTNIVVKKSDDYLGHYIVQIMGTKTVGILTDAAVGKPVHLASYKGPTESLKVLPATLIRYGTPTTDTHHNIEFSAMMFKVRRDLEHSILKGLKENPKISEEILDVIKDYFKGDLAHIKWGVEVSESEQNELGKYLGELIIGLLAFKNNGAQFSSPFLDSQAVSFTIPTDSKFSGVDSFIRTSKGTLIPISSKFGVGAKASFFSNIVPKALGEHYNDIKKCEFKNIVNVFLKYNLDPLVDTKRALYTYGIYDILKIGYNNVPDPLAIYDGIRSNRWTHGTDDVFDAIKRRSWGLVNEDVIKQGLPNTLTAFFNRIITKRLNEDATSINEMKRIISGKNFWQANLDIVKWKKGIVYYKMIHSSDNKLTIIGNKSGLNDLASSAGMINYDLRSGT